MQSQLEEQSIRCLMGWLKGLIPRFVHGLAWEIDPRKGVWLLSGLSLTVPGKYWMGDWKDYGFFFSKCMLTTALSLSRSLCRSGTSLAELTADTRFRFWREIHTPMNKDLKTHMTAV